MKLSPLSKRILSAFFLGGFLYLTPLLVHAQATPTPTPAPIIQEFVDCDATHPNGCMIGGVPTLKCLEVVFNNLIVFGSSLSVIILFCMLCIGGYKYMMSFGDEGKMGEAVNTMKYAVYGMVLFACAYFILNLIDTLFLGGQKILLQFSIGGPVC